jgi:glycine cleavage system aminomethyltransferase T
MALADFKRIDHFGDPAAEARACRSACALFDFSFLESTRLRGEKARQVLEYFTGQSLADLPIGRIRYALRVNAAGKLLADLTIWRTAAETFELISGRREDVVEVSDHAGPAVAVSTIADRAIFALQGPASLQALGCLGSTEAIGALPYFGFCDTTLDDVPCRIGRLGYTGEPGFEIIFPRTARDRLWQALARHARPAGFTALDMLRIEAGFVLFTQDFRLPVTPAEAGLGKFYQAAAGSAPNLRLVSFVADADRLDWPWQASARLEPPARDEIVVTSACDSVVAGGILGLGYVRAGHEPGAPLRDPTETFRNIRQTPLPYYDTTKRRPRQPWPQS